MEFWPAVYGVGVIEIMTFQLRADADVAAFVKFDARVQTEVAYQCEGMLRRTLGRNADRWLVMQTWATPEACEAGRHVIESSPLGQRFVEFVDSSTSTVEQFGAVD